MKRSSTKLPDSVNLSPERRDLLTKLLVDDLSEILKGDVRQWINERLFLIADLLMNREVLEIVGERHERKADRDCSRHGAQPGSVYLLEQKVPVRKPRIRTSGATGSEVELESYKALNDKEFLCEQAAAKLLSGTSTRRFKSTLEKMLRAKGVSRQAVSQKSIEYMGARLEEFHNRSLQGADMIAVFIDGIHIGENVYVTAVGIDTRGYRHVLEFEQGSTESSSICRSLLRNLLERQILDEEGAYLFVVDGGKGVKKALKDVFGKRAYIQRCIVHKKRNVRDKLPKKEQQEFEQKFNAAYGKKTHKAAETAFLKVINELKLQHRQSAANSMTEGLSELLTLHKLGISGNLRRSLYSTNCIESVFSAARYFSRNVKRWRKEEQMERWLATGLLEAEKKLRRIPGYTNLKKLSEALKR